jgi:hypothetical protein
VADLGGIDFILEDIIDYPFSINAATRFHAPNTAAVALNSTPAVTGPANWVQQARNPPAVPSVRIVRARCTELTDTSVTL